MMKRISPISLHGIAFLLVALLLMMAVPEVHAQEAEAQEAQTLTMQEALERARENSEQVRQALAEVQKSELSVSEARAGRLPDISVNGQYTNNVKLPVIFMPEGSPFGDVLETGSQHNFNTSMQATMPLYNPQVNRSIALSEAAAQLEHALHEATVREVEIEVQRAFFSALMTREAWNVLQQSHETLEHNLELVKSLYEEGMAPEYDLIRTEVQVRNMEPELSRAKNNHEGALNYLKLLTGISMDNTIAVDGSLEAFYATLPALDFEASFEQNADLIQIEGQRQIAQRQLSLERAAYLPSISAVGNLSYQSQGDNLAVHDYNWVNSSSVGLSISIPLFSGGRSKSVERAEVDRRQADIQREFLLESLQSEFETTSSRIEELSETIEAQQRNIEQAERGYEIARASYEEGVHTLMDVNDAEEALTNARLNYKNALSDYINAVLDMEDLVGSTLTVSAQE